MQSIWSCPLVTTITQDRHILRPVATKSIWTLPHMTKENKKVQMYKSIKILINWQNKILLPTLESIWSCPLVTTISQYRHILQPVITKSSWTLPHMTTEDKKTQMYKSIKIVITCEIKYFYQHCRASGVVHWSPQ